MNQQVLWHDSLDDAIRSAVEGLGGPKKIGNALWPAKNITDAARLLNHCLDSDRPEKLSTNEFEFIFTEAAKAGIHVIAAYLLNKGGYRSPEPVTEEEEEASLISEVSVLAEGVGNLMKRVERFEQRKQKNL